MSFSGSSAIDMMMHAVGHMKKNGRYTLSPYRNHYCASEEDVPPWLVLVSMGLAEMSSFDGSYTTFRVSEAGLAFLRALRRAKRRSVG